MIKNSIVVGHNEGVPYEFTSEEQFRHLCLFGASEQYKECQILNLNILKENLSKGFGALILHDKKDNLRQTILNELASINRKNDFMDIEKIDVDKLQTVFLDSVTHSQILFFDISSCSTAFIRDFLKAIWEVVEFLREKPNTNVKNTPKNPYIIQVNDISVISDPIWHKILLFARQVGIFLIFKFDSFHNMKRSLEDPKMKRDVELIVESVGNKAVFNQRNTDDNLEVSRFLDIPKIEISGGFLGLIKKKVHMLEAAQKKQFVFINGMNYELLNLP